MRNFSRRRPRPSAAERHQEIPGDQVRRWPGPPCTPPKQPSAHEQGRGGGRRPPDLSPGDGIRPAASTAILLLTPRRWGGGRAAGSRAGRNFTAVYPQAQVHNPRPTITTLRMDRHAYLDGGSRPSGRRVVEHRRGSGPLRWEGRSNGSGDLHQRGAWRRARTRQTGRRWSRRGRCSPGAVSRAAGGLPAPGCRAPWNSSATTTQVCPIGGTGTATTSSARCRLPRRPGVSLICSSATARTSSSPTPTTAATTIPTISTPTTSRSPRSSAPGFQPSSTTSPGAGATFDRLREAMRARGLELPDRSGPDPQRRAEIERQMEQLERQITTSVDIAAVIDRKRAALTAHASQLDESWLSRLPPELFLDVFGQETFIRAQDTTAAPVPENDLFAGLWGRSDGRRDPGRDPDPRTARPGRQSVGHPARGVTAGASRPGRPGAASRPDG